MKTESGFNFYAKIKFHLKERWAKGRKVEKALRKLKPSTEN